MDKRNEIVLLHLALQEVSVNAVNITNLPRYNPMRSLVQELRDLLVGNEHFRGPFLSLLYEFYNTPRSKKHKNIHHIRPNRPTDQDLASYFLCHWPEVRLEDANPQCELTTSQEHTRGNNNSAPTSAKDNGIYHIPTSGALAQRGTHQTPIMKYSVRRARLATTSKISSLEASQKAGGQREMWASLSTFAKSAWNPMLAPKFLVHIASLFCVLL
jgi:hypothetical protein